MAKVNLTIEHRAHNAKGLVTLTARLGDECIALQKLDITKSKARQAFVKQVCEGRAGIQESIVAEELLRIADAVTHQDQNPDGDLHEVEDTRIVRPERFITPEVSGLTAATTVISEGKPKGRWLQYLHWHDSTREVRQLSDVIQRADMPSLWLHPLPPEPTPSAARAWTAQARKNWLTGAPAPNAAELLSRIFEQIAFYLEFPPEHAHGITATLGLWAIFTFVYSAWDAVPYLYIGGPLGSGKSRLFDVLCRLVFRPLASSNLTAPALFRTLHNRGGTLLLDEAERLRQSTPDVGDMLSMLLAGYKRGGKATRLEPVGDSFNTVEFDVYGPKALACIAGLPPALSSRCIPVTMFRAGPDSSKPRRRIDADPQTWQSIRDDLHALALEQGNTWLELSQRSDVCPRMTGRQYELWQPLLALAAWIEKEDQHHRMSGLHALMQDHALAVIESSKDDETPEADEVLLRVLAEKVVANLEPTPTQVLEAAKEIDPDLFRNWRAATVGRHLKRYGLATKLSGDRRYRDIRVGKFREIQRNYQIELGIAESPIDLPSIPSTPSILSPNGVNVAANLDGLDGLDG